MSACSPSLYYATSQKPTAIFHVAVGAFTSAAALNVIVATTTRVEVHAVTRAGLEPVCDVGIYGRISALRLVPRGTDRAQLLLTTERQQLLVLEWDESARTLKTIVSGDLRVRRPRGCSCARCDLSTDVDPFPPRPHL